MIRRAGAELIRRRFNTSAQLTVGVYAALVQYLEDCELIRTGPFDAAICTNAMIADLDDERIATFLGRARRARALPLREGASTEEVLTHLSLLHHGKPTHAAVLLFSAHPQRFLISSMVKCAHYHGTQVAKPIPSLQTYRGTLFELVDQAIDFVMSKLDLSVGTRALGPQAPVAYEIPQGSGGGGHRECRRAPRLYKQRQCAGHAVFRPTRGVGSGRLAAVGTGTEDMIRRCREHGLPDPEFSIRGGFVATVWRKPRPESRPESDEISMEIRVFRILEIEAMSKSEISANLGHQGCLRPPEHGHPRALGRPNHRDDAPRQA